MYILLVLLILYQFMFYVHIVSFEVDRSGREGCRVYRKGGCYGWKPSSSSNHSIRVVGAYPPREIRHTAPCRAIRGDSIGVNSTLPPFLVVGSSVSVSAYIHIYIYIYIYREREREICICMCICICTYTHDILLLVGSSV